MIFLTIFIVNLYLLCFFLYRKESISPAIKSYLRPFQKLTNRILRTTWISKIYSPKVKEHLRELYPPMYVEKRNLEHYREKISLLLLVLFVGNLLVLCLQISLLASDTLSEEGMVQRNAHGERGPELELEVLIKEDTQNISYAVGEQKYSAEEIQAIFDEIQAHAERMILGENEDLEHVTTDLYLPTKAPGFPVQIEWVCDSYTYLAKDGRVFNENLEEEHVAKLTMILSYEDFRREFEFFVLICPPEKTKPQLLQESILQALATEDKKQETQETFALPKEIEIENSKESVTFREIKKNNGSLLFGLVLISCLALTISKDKDLEKKVMDKRKRLLFEYPEFICKLSLLIGAGMTVKGAMVRLAGDYQREKEKGVKSKYVYEEVFFTVGEMENGIFEETAYENFGKRCKVPQYTKLSVLLVQNMKKGSGDLKRMLDAETTEAFEIRKSHARRLGEEATTKLLLPMMLMLGIVMLMIIVPAFLSYQL